MCRFSSCSIWSIIYTRLHWIRLCWQVWKFIWVIEAVQFSARSRCIIWKIEFVTDKILCSIVSTGSAVFVRFINNHYLWHHIYLFIRFQVKKKQFFRNFMTIMLFGAVGTLISFFIISLGNAQELLPKILDNSHVWELQESCIEKNLC